MRRTLDSGKCPAVQINKLASAINYRHAPLKSLGACIDHSINIANSIQDSKTFWCINKK